MLFFRYPPNTVMQLEGVQTSPGRGFCDFHYGRKFWVLVYIVPWFIIGFLSAIFLNKSSHKPSPISLDPVDDPNSIGFSWKSLPWITNKKLNDPLVANYPISIHGQLDPSIERIYRSSANISAPLYASVASSCISRNGFVVHSNKEYPQSSNQQNKQKIFGFQNDNNDLKKDNGHPWFPAFSLSNFSQDPKDPYTYPRIISLPQPPGMSDYFFISNILPLLFILPEETIRSSTICFTRVSPALQDFLQQTGLNFRYVTSEKTTVCGEEIIIPKLPEESQVAQTADLILSEAFANNLATQIYNGVIVARDGDPSFRRREILSKKLTEQSRNIFIIDKKWNLAQQIGAIMNTRVALGFGGDQMNLVMFMQPGATFIEVQRDDVISRPVLIARALGSKVHVIPVKEGDILTDDVLNTIVSIVKSL